MLYSKNQINNELKISTSNIYSKIFRKNFKISKKLKYNKRIQKLFKKNFDSNSLKNLKKTHNNIIVNKKLLKYIYFNKKFLTHLSQYKNINSYYRNKFYLKKRSNISLSARFQISGRLNGVRMARIFRHYQGYTGASSFKYPSSYRLKNVYTKWGILGLKIWV